MGTERHIHDDSRFDVFVWENPKPTSLIVKPKHGFNIGDDEPVELELDYDDIKMLLGIADDEGLGEQHD